MAGNHLAALLLHTARHHTKMLALYYNRYASWIQNLLNGLGDLGGHAFLNLQPPGKHVRYSRQF
jgi:hypothetical protein